MSYDQSKYLFCDVETTGLDPNVHSVWEVAMIIDGHEYCWQIKPGWHENWVYDLAALRINKMLDRLDDDQAIEADRLSGIMLPEISTDVNLTGILAGRHVVGANPRFDMDFLAPLFSTFVDPPWRYRPYDITSMAMGCVGAHVNGLAGAAEALGLELDPDEHHSALYDARLARQIFEAIMGDPE